MLIFNLFHDCRPPWGDSHLVKEAFVWSNHEVNCPNNCDPLSDYLVATLNMALAVLCVFARLVPIGPAVRRIEMNKSLVSLCMGLFIVCGIALTASGQTHTVVAENGGNTG